MKTEGVILAAGFSSRTAVNKMTLDLHGKMIIEHCLESMYESCDRIIVVGGYRIEELEPVIKKYRKAELCFNDNYPAGMFSSIQKGLAQIRAPRFFITPGDYPLINKRTYEKMFKQSADIIIPTFKGIPGHPVLLQSNLIKEILCQPVNSTLREFIRSKPLILLEVSDPGILLDIDTMKDYKNIMETRNTIYREEQWSTLSPGR